MEIYKIYENFILNVLKEGTYASDEEIRNATVDVLSIIRDNKDSTVQEMVSIILDNVTKDIMDIVDNYPIPGFTFGVDTGNINVKLYGGDVDETGRELSSDAIFDVASVTKFYTQIVAYNLINEGYFNYDDKVKDLDFRFKNLGDLTVGDILTFTTSFRTSGRLTDKSGKEEALDALFDIEVVKKGEYNYNDMGLMIMKEVMEKLTGKSYPELVNHYIINRLDLRNTHLIVPENKIELLTGSPNASKGKVNDPKALIMGGYSGHAGIFASSDDLIKLGKGFMNKEIINDKGLNDAMNHGVEDVRGIMGNTFTSDEEGVIFSFVDRLSPKKSFAVQGSTRTQLNVGKDGMSTILLNPSSMGLERALYEEKKFNLMRKAEGLSPLNLVQHFNFDGNNYTLIDARMMTPSAETEEVLTTINAKLMLKLRLLNEFMKEYDKNYSEEISVTKKIK